MIDANLFITTDDALLRKRRGYLGLIAWLPSNVLVHHE